jgi:ParB family chromosome partitioning protein
LLYNRNIMENPPVQGPVFLIEVDRISPNPHQPRRDFDPEALQELATSIREFGVIQPIVVTKLEKDSETGTQVEYQLIAGERRWRASQLAGLERIPAIIRRVELERDRLELAILENIQREDLNPIETARAYAQLQDKFTLTQREIAARLGKSREAVANTVRLLNLPSNIQEALSRKQISESQGRLLLTVPDIAHQQTLFEDLLKNSLSVRELKSRIKKSASPAPIEIYPAAPMIDPETAALQQQLEEVLGTKVKVEKNGETGKLVIDFYSPDDLRALLNRLTESQTPPAAENPPEEFTV